MEDLNIPIFAQAKIEYTKQLVDILYPHMFDGVKSIYDEAKVIYANKTGTPILFIFRELLEKVPIWNSEIIDAECSRIVHNSSCDWFDDLITAVFISHTKILTSIGPNQSFTKINVTIPKSTTFIHKSYINVAREIWKNPYLFNEQVPGHEYQRNSKEVENIIKVCIETTVRNLLPVKEILREHLDNEQSTNPTKDDLKQLLREELLEIKKTQSVGEPDDSLVDEGTQETHEAEAPEETTREAEAPEEATKDAISDVISELKETIALNKALEEPRLSLDPEKPPIIIPVKEEVSQPATVDLTPAPSTTPSYPSLSDDPSEAQVAKQCSDIVVHDITLPVDVETGDSNTEVQMKDLGNAVLTPPNPTLGTEVKYDNVDVIQSTDTGVPSEKTQQMKKLLTMASDVKGKPDISVVKQPTIQPAISPPPAPTPSFSLSNLYPNMSSSKPEPAPAPAPTPDAVTETKPLVPATEAKPEPPPPEPKSPRVEVAEIKSEEINDTDSLAGFLNDVKQIVEDKGIKVDTSNNGMFTLFEDAYEVEK
jgi:hypothetical protein